MAQVGLTLETIGDLDNGNAQAAINGALSEACRDLDERGEDEKPRKVIVTVTMEKLDKGGPVKIDLDVQVKVPPYKTNTTIAETRIHKQKPQLVFQQHAPNDPNQRTIDEMESREEAD